MAWRDTFLRHLGPGLLCGMTAGDWLGLLREHRFAVAPSRLPKAASITLQSLQNSVLRLAEDWRFGSRVRDAVIQPPLFLLGHWRQGTTHLHNLIATDGRFAFPNNYQALYPHTFLSTEAVASRVVGWFLPKRRPMDNVEWDMTSSQEDEFALNIASRVSPYMQWMFPRGDYDRFLTMRGATPAELARWKAAFVLFLKKLTWKYGRPLVLKSPPHTARVRLLLDLFPAARFVHIRRDPFAVFASTTHMFRVNDKLNNLQRPRGDTDGWVLRQYRAMYAAYFEEKGLIPAGRLVEVAFEDLEADPVGQIRRVYESLGLPDFGTTEPALLRYLAAVAGYKKNSLPVIAPTLRERIVNEWRPSFEAWGYPIGQVT
jgi:omega-hydroxy-beta-dihydromenaquinone-9 sulfotransferase